MGYTSVEGIVELNRVLNDDCADWCDIAQASGWALLDVVPLLEAAGAFKHLPLGIVDDTYRRIFLENGDDVFEAL